MFRSFSRSLSLRIFFITLALLLAACAATYGAIAYFTPISYTALLADELQKSTEKLLADLNESTALEAGDLLDDFTRETGARLRLEDGWGTALYDNLPAEVTVVEDYVAEGTGSVVEESAEMADVFTTAESAEIEEVRIGYIARVDGERLYYHFAFADGREAYLTVEGGRRAVNQAAEAMGRLLPYLALGILLISLLTAYLYAKSVTRPIVEISALAGRIAQMDFHARWQGRRRDEIGSLGESLNRLSDNLSAAMDALKSANAKLKMDIEREREVERQRLNFFSAASHELKTPVTILKGQLSGMLARVGAYKDREKYLARALEVTGRMEKLIQEILTLSRLDSGKMGAEKAEVNLSKLMLRQLELDGELMEQKNLHLSAQICPDVLIQGNAGLLSNAIDNVLMNAILYSPEGAEIHVELTPEGFFVENSGAHVDEAALLSIFEPFSRAEPSRNRKSGGSGLGLYLVKSVLRLHGMDCEMKNTPTGVRFSCKIITA